MFAITFLYWETAASSHMVIHTSKTIVIVFLNVQMSSFIDESLRQNSTDTWNIAYDEYV